MFTRKKIIIHVLIQIIIPVVIAVTMLLAISTLQSSFVKFSDKKLELVYEAEGLIDGLKLNIINNYILSEELNFKIMENIAIRIKPGEENNVLQSLQNELNELEQTLETYYAEIDNITTERNKHLDQIENYKPTIWTFLMSNALQITTLIINLSIIISFLIKFFKKIGGRRLFKNY